MKFSTFHLFPKPGDWSVSQVYDYELQVIQCADELGFDCAWIAEHHFRDYGVVPNILLLLANIAARTKRIRLGSAIVILPFQHPLRVAEDAAMVDIVSGGRLNFGFGRGYQGVEFAGLGVPMDDSRARADEALDIILKAWSGEPFSHQGKYHTINNIRLIPAPVQRPHPPVFVASISPESIRHYAKRGIPFIVSGQEGFTGLKDACTAWREIATASGRPGKGEIVASRPVYLADTNEQAKAFVLSTPPSLPFAQAFNPHRQATTAHERYARDSAPIDPKTGKVAKGYEYWEQGYQGRRPSDFLANTELAWEERWIAGDLERVLRKIEDLQRIGVRNLICAFGVRGVGARPPLADVRRAMERFARDVMPHFAARAR
jgi:alkanesulfonate monooxygenase SsuD/methylene tetrahydromethanopterin reductase-like flavin-dependent oxidoreductase (luciferase family)